MSFSNGIRIISWIFLVIIKDDIVLGQSPGPNAVAFINGQTMLDCVTNLLATSTWTRTMDGTNNPMAISVGCSVSGSNAAYYKTAVIGGNICRLTIANATMQQAGVYDCSAGSLGISYRSLVTIIDPVANVVVHNQSSEVVENDQLNISCSITYTGPSSPAPSLRPLPYWSTSLGQIFTSAIYRPSTNVVTLVATVRVQKPTVPIFQCKTVFEITGSSSAFNSTAPGDTFTVGSTTELNVQYGPSTPNISHVMRDYRATDGTTCTVTTLTCSSMANPEANYTWRDVTNGNQLVIGVSGNVFDWAEDNRTYECTAFNNIRNSRRSSSAVYAVNVTSSHPCVSVKSSDIRICSDDGRCDNEATSRSCSNSSRIIYLTCDINNVYPKPTQFQWKDDQSGNVVSNTASYNATINGDYTVSVYNEINQQTKTAAEANVRVTDCLSSPPTTKSTETSATPRSASNTEIIIIVVVVASWVLLNLIAMTVFLIYYNWKDRNGKHEQKKILNNYFPSLKLMLPCLNQSTDSGCSRCLWIFLFVLMSVTVGLIVFSFLLIRANCKCCTRNADTAASSSTSNSQDKETEFSTITNEDSTTRGHIGRRTNGNRSQPSNESRGNPVPYEECNIKNSKKSKTHNKEKTTTPFYTEVDKKKQRNDDQEIDDPYSVIPPNSDDIDNIPKASSAVPLPPIKPSHRSSAQNPNAPLYSELNVASNFRNPVQLMAEGSDTQYAPLRKT